MTMTIHRLFSHALLSSALLAAGSTWAATPPKGAVPGFLDLKTGTFTAHVAPQRTEGTSAEAAATYTGTLLMKFNITLKSGVPADYQIQCTQYATVSDSLGSYSETKTVVATRTGSTATCSVAIYYSWLLSSGDQTVSQSYSVSTYGNGSLVQRDASAYGLFTDMPVNGGSNSKTLNITL
jgi:hypothetical protein